MYQDLKKDPVSYFFIHTSPTGHSRLRGGCGCRAALSPGVRNCTRFARWMQSSVAYGNINSYTELIPAVLAADLIFGHTGFIKEAS